MKGYGIKFREPVKALSVDREIQCTDRLGDFGVWIVDAAGITNRSSSGPFVVDTDGERIDRVENVYKHNQSAVIRLRALAAAYHAMRDAMQAQWDAELANLTKIEDVDDVVRVEIDR